MKKSDKEMNVIKTFGRCQHYHFDIVDDKGFRFIRCENPATGTFKRTKKAILENVVTRREFLDKDASGERFFNVKEIERMREVKSYGGKRMNLCDSCVKDWRYDEFDMVPCRM